MAPAGAARDVHDFAPAVVVIAHEGARNPAAARRSLAWGANAVEMDVVAYRGQLYVSHHHLSSDQAAYTPTVGQVWPIASRARVVEFDLKQSSPSFCRLLVAFLAAHSGHGMPQILVSSRNLTTLQVIKAGAPRVFRFLSIGSAGQLMALRLDPAALPLLDGVSILHNLLDPPTIAWLHAHHLLVFAWTVDEPERAQTLLHLGVDGITTDQSGIVTAISRLERGERRLVRRTVN